MQRVNATIHIFRAGRHVDSGGTARPFTQGDIQSMAAMYRESLHPAPVVLGHPPDDKPVYGKVDSLFERGGDLFAKLWFVPSMAQAIKAGAYRKVSASFYAPGAPRNPRPGVWYLRHVGLLGAAPPAIKGLHEMRFSEDAGVCFGEGLSINLNPEEDDMKYENCEPERLAMHRKIQDRMKKQPGLTYAGAALHVDAEFEFSEDGSFSERMPDFSGAAPDRADLHDKIRAHQRRHPGMTYSEAFHAVVR